jgi:hypothetical protein
MQHIHADLRGDGRLLVHPRPRTEHVGNPKSIPLARARDCVAAFQANGLSTHSNAGELIWIVVEWCSENHVGLRVTTLRERGEVVGYTVRRLNSSDPIYEDRGPFP